jgi:hypothetical protein
MTMNKNFINSLPLLLWLLMGVDILATEATDNESGDMRSSSHNLRCSNDALWEEYDREITAEREKNRNLSGSQDESVEQNEAVKCEVGVAFRYKDSDTKCPFFPYRPYPTYPTTGDNGLEFIPKMPNSSNQFESAQPEHRIRPSSKDYEDDIKFFLFSHESFAYPK